MSKIFKKFKPLLSLCVIIFTLFFYAQFTAKAVDLPSEPVLLDGKLTEGAWIGFEDNCEYSYTGDQECGFRINENISVTLVFDNFTTTSYQDYNTIEVLDNSHLTIKLIGANSFYNQASLDHVIKLAPTSTLTIIGEAGSSLSISPNANSTTGLAIAGSTSVNINNSYIKTNSSISVNSLSVTNSIIQASDATNISDSSTGVFFIGNNEGYVKGDVTVPTSFEIPAGKTLRVSGDNKLTTNYNNINNGTFIVEKPTNVSGTGSVSGATLIYNPQTLTADMITVPNNPIYDKTKDYFDDIKIEIPTSVQINGNNYAVQHNIDTSLWTKTVRNSSYLPTTTVTNAGYYTVKYSNGSEEITKEFAIDKINTSISIIDVPTDVKYPDKATLTMNISHPGLVTISSGGKLISTKTFDTSGEVEMELASIQGGSYFTYAVFRPNDIDNFGFSQATFNLTINPATDNTITASIENWTYGETPSNEVVTSTYNNHTINWYNSKNEKLSAKPANAGNYFLEVTSSATNNYNEATPVRVPFTIEKRPVTVTFVASDKVYDGTVDATLNFIFKDGDIVEGDKITFTGITAVFKDKDVGENKIVYSVFNNHNITGDENYRFPSGIGNQMTANITPYDCTDTDFSATDCMTLNYNAFNELTFNGINNEVINGTTLYDNKSYSEYISYLNNSEFKANEVIDIPILFTATGNYTGTISGELHLTINDIYFTNTDNMVTLSDSITYGDTLSEIFTFDTSNVVANLDTTPDVTQEITGGEYTLYVDGEIFDGSKILESGLHTYYVLYNNDIAFVDEKVCEVTSFTVNKAPITILDLTNLVTAPQKNAVPNTTLIHNEQFDATVSWIDNPTKFLGGTSYTAQVTITPTNSYTTTGIAQNSFTYDNQTVTNNVDSNIVNIIFTATEERLLTALEITTPPTKLNYIYNDNFDSTGMVVKAVYDDGTTNENFTEYTISNDTNLAVGTQNITIFALDVTVNQAVTVSKASQNAPTVPEYSYTISSTDNTKFIAIATAIDNAQYSLDGITWQDQNSFDNLAPLTDITIYVRIKETATHNASDYVTTQQFTLEKFNREVTITPITQKLTVGNDDITLFCDSSKDVVYSSSDSSIISINGNQAKICGAGTVAITVTLAETAVYNTATDSITVTVNEYIPPVIIPTPTPTVKPTPTVTPSPTVAPAQPVAPVVTVAPTIKPTVKPTTTPSATPTPTITPTATPKPVATPSPTPSEIQANKNTNINGGYTPIVIGGLCFVSLTGLMFGFKKKR